jgi:hypothetical protein
MVIISDVQVSNHPAPRQDWENHLSSSDQTISDTAYRTFLIPALVFRMGALDGQVGHEIPRVMDTDKQEHDHDRTDEIQSQRRIRWERNRGGNKYDIRDERKYDIPLGRGTSLMVAARAAGLLMWLTAEG